MQNDIEYPKNPRKGKVMAGLILLIVGSALLLHQVAGFLFPSWLFDWPMILILVGLYTGSKHDFKKPSSFLLIIFGVIFLLDDIIPGANLSNLIWPMIIITFGILMILGRNKSWGRKKWNQNQDWNKKDWGKNYDWDKRTVVEEPIVEPVNMSDEPASSAYAYTPQPPPASPIGEDYLDAVSIFGGINKTILSKNFKGGDIVNVFGGAEIDFTQADINGRVVIEITQIFGGTKLIVPPHWHVTSDMVALFAGTDDKRRNRAELANDKVLVLKGTSIFAGVEIRSY